MLVIDGELREGEKERERGGVFLKRGKYKKKPKQRERLREKGYLKVLVFASKLNTLNREQFLESSSICGLIPSVVVDGELGERERERKRERNIQNTTPHPPPPLSLFLSLSQLSIDDDTGNQPIDAMVEYF